MTALIDLDGILYRGLFGAKEENCYKQLRNCEDLIEKVEDRFECKSLLFLSSSHNFRYVIYPAYKANRKDSERPRYLFEARKYFIKYWGAQQEMWYEADDLIAMRHGADTIAVSNDKDFLQLGGNIYNPFTDTLYYIDNPEYYFYMQLLVGDKIDNIPGIGNPEKKHHKNPPNFTEKTASELLKDLSKEDMKVLVQDLYFQQFGDDWVHEYERNAKLLFLKRSPEANYYDYF